MNFLWLKSLLREWKVKEKFFRINKTAKGLTRNVQQTFQISMRKVTTQQKKMEQKSEKKLSNFSWNYGSWNHKLSYIVNIVHSDKQ